MKFHCRSAVAAVGDGGVRVPDQMLQFYIGGRWVRVLAAEVDGEFSGHAVVRRVVLVLTIDQLARQHTQPRAALLQRIQRLEERLRGEHGGRGAPRRDAFLQSA